MDDYYISKEDWDTIITLGVDEKKGDTVLKRISAATKTALTRMCANFDVYALYFKFAHGLSCPNLGTTRVDTRYPSTRPKVWEKSQRKSSAGLRPTLRKPM